MRERPILFSGPMVRALLAGRKTVTRRVVKRQPPVTAANDAAWPDPRADLWRNARQYARDRCPYGAPGDRLWVREAHRLTLCTCETCHVPGYVWYEADSSGYEHVQLERLRPSIHMPRWACRLVLELVSVRVERLQEITEEDAAAEAAHPVPCEPASIAFGTWKARHRYRDGYRALWDSLNAARGFGWEANPWVWVVEFRRVSA